MSRFWQIWLREASLLLVGFGVLCALIVVPPLDTPIRFVMELVFWPAATVPAFDGPGAVFVIGISGAMLMGWGIMMYFAATHGMTRETAWVRQSLLVGILVWFLVDGLVSFAVGAYINIVSNTLFAALFLAPLIAGRDRALPAPAAG